MIKFYVLPAIEIRLERSLQITKRYHRKNPEGEDEIYPGTLEGLQTALADACEASLTVPGTHEVRVHNPPEPTALVRQFENGDLT